MEFETWANLFDTNKIRLDFQKELRSSSGVNRQASLNYEKMEDYKKKAAYKNV